MIDCVSAGRIATGPNRRAGRLSPLMIVCRRLAQGPNRPGLQAASPFDD